MEWYSVYGWIDPAPSIKRNSTIVHCVWLSWPFGIEIGNPLTPPFNLFNGRLGPQTRSFLFPFSGATLLMVTRSIHSFVHVCQWVHYKSYIYTDFVWFLSRGFEILLEALSVHPSVHRSVRWSVGPSVMIELKMRSFATLIGHVYLAYFMGCILWMWSNICCLQLLNVHCTWTSFPKNKAE